MAPLTRVPEVGSEALRHSCLNAVKVRRPGPGLVLLLPGRPVGSLENLESLKSSACVSSPFKTEAARLPVTLRTDWISRGPRDSSVSVDHKQMFSYHDLIIGSGASERIPEQNSSNGSVETLDSLSARACARPDGPQPAAPVRLANVWREESPGSLRGPIPSRLLSALRWQPRATVRGSPPAFHPLASLTVTLSASAAAFRLTPKRPN